MDSAEDSVPHDFNTSNSHHASKPSMNGMMAGFSHNAFNSNMPSFGGVRARGVPYMPTLNTTRALQNHANVADLQSPMTSYDPFTPLLPSQLLMGSPFQAHSPTTFGAAQMHFPSYPPPNAMGSMHQQAQHVGSPVQAHQPMSPTMYNNVMAPAQLSPQLFAAQQLTGGGMGQNFSNSMHFGSGFGPSNSRTVYLGNLPAETTAEEILNHVRSGQIESVRLLSDKNCAFISFLESNSATHFYHDAGLKKLNIRGQEIKVGWGKPSNVPFSVTVAVQQSNASRNVYLGNLSPDVTEEHIREELSKFGAIDMIKMVREKNIGFVHFLSIGSAVKAVTNLPHEPAWGPPRRVFYGKDRCAYISKTQQQNAAQFLGIAPNFASALHSVDRDMLTNALAQQSVAAAAVATAAGGMHNVGNRTVYLGNIHPETTTEEICNVVRGGLLHHIRYIPDKHICFVTFIDPTAAAAFYSLSHAQGLMIHNRRLKLGWGKHSGPLPPAIALAVSGGASRNVYVGNIDESWTEERLRQDFSEYGEIELVNTLREKSCAFVNFTNIANAIKAIEGKEQRREGKT